MQMVLLFLSTHTHTNPVVYFNFKELYRFSQLLRSSEEVRIYTDHFYFVNLYSHSIFSSSSCAVRQEGAHYSGHSDLVNGIF